jgi:hypothetical protein
MPITTREWIDHVDTLGDERELVVGRLMGQGVDEGRARWLVAGARRRRLAGGIARLGFFVGVTGFAWLAWMWLQALRGDPDTPGTFLVLRPALLAFGGMLVFLVASAIGFTNRLDIGAYTAIPEELTPPPRQVDDDTWKLVLTIVCADVAMLVAVMSATILPQVRNTVWLQQRGVESVGTVSEMEIRRGPKGQISHHIRYDFEGHDGWAAIPESRYSALHRGDHVPVTYLADRPEINRPQAKRDVRAFSQPDPLPIGFLALGLVLVFVLVRALTRRRRRLAEEGVATIATIIDVRPQRFRYAFEVEENRVEGMLLLNRQKVREMPRVGDKVVVLYDPANPRRSVALAALSRVAFRTT